MYNKNIKNNNGSAMTLTIILMALMSIFATIISKQLSNQIKSTTKNYDHIQGKYVAESGVERVLEEASNQLVENIREAYITQSTKSYTTGATNSSKSIDDMNKELENLKSHLINISNLDGVALIINKINSVSTPEDLLSSLDSIRNDMLNVLVNTNGSGMEIKIQSDIKKSVEYLNNAQYHAQVYKNKDVEPLALRNSNYHEDVNYNKAEINKFINSSEFQRIISNASTACGYLGWNSQSKGVHDNTWSINNMIWSYHNLFTNENANPLDSQSVKNQLKEINKAIDSIIEEINNIQLELVTLYANEYNNRGNLESAFKVYDSMKNDYIYISKRLEIGIDGTQETPSIDINNKTTLKLENYNNIITTQTNKYIYEVEYLNEEGDILKYISKPINIIRDKNNNILSISDIEVDIVSTAYKESSRERNIQYKMKATVVFKVYKDDNLRVKYEIKSYKALPIK